jgi:small multidrug resistance family-3 protein
MNLVRALAPWLALAMAAVMEVGGDAAIRAGLRGRGWALVVLGCLVLAGYGLVVNLIEWDFSRLFGVYVAAFALASVLAGRFWFREDVPTSTWAGLGLILLGALVIQVGAR